MMSEDQTKSSMCGRLSSCFSRGGLHHEALDDVDDCSSRVRTPRGSPRAWLRSTAHDLPEIRDRCRNLISRWKSRRHHHHQYQSSDFSYDLSSYALNFEDDSGRDDEAFPLKNFSSTAAKFASESVSLRSGLIVGFS
ncbi:hypothetical protein TorRG33x02_126330 [Trema orientale]|uniref:Uncharacterized protein n=1 Tax=Trema orientale TaxID=63057 RepID=A0A2P5F1C4_TREOI|nr:hypothetical protein TorRG33x02_126330 [Trema orientale]